MRPTLFEFAGGEPAMLALAAAHHARCLADPELAHPFSHADLNPEHVQRLAAYWAEVFGGPPRYSQLAADQSSLQRLHAGNGDMGDLGRRFVDCFVVAADDARLPADAAFRATLRAYMEWAVADVLAYSAPDAVVPPGQPMPHWSWDGLSPGPAAPAGGPTDEQADRGGQRPGPPGRSDGGQ
jgi:hemoglobin